MSFGGLLLLLFIRCYDLLLFIHFVTEWYTSGDWDNDMQDL